MIQTTAIIGMGALGLMYADTIAKARGRESVSFVMNKERLQKYKDAVFTCNGEEKTFQMRDCEEMEPVDLLIVAVKYNGLPDAMKDMRKCVGENTIIMSVMNGITSEKMIAEEFGMEKLIDTVAQGMDAMKFGSKLRFTQMGELHIGVEAGQKQENVDAVAEFFDDIRMPYVVEEDILFRMWAKFMLNVGINQTCMAYETTYSGALTEGTEANHTLIAAMREVITLSNAEKIGLSEKDLWLYIDILKTLDPEGVPSMRQDGIARRYSEVEMFAGTVIKMAEKHGIDTPANRLLYQKVKAIEATY